MEIIRKIKEGEFRRPGINGMHTYIGYVVSTDKRDIYLGISDNGQCCEMYGYLTSEDNLEPFVGAELFGITRTDTSLLTQEIPTNPGEPADTMFINIETSCGVLQFVAYNSHNGAYGHDAVAWAEDLCDHLERL